ncbi:endoplasmic reticulum-Golgi intermediate compartment protein 3-like [Ascaphus truei]|uniref:endoplasmic reticulum-Golgi intermediate compartment protein 3-like n=1 Tax=Ascaphus truei TaxID=8439 RepID=UPI003F5A038E
MTHHIKHLSFGRDYPGIVNPLDGTSVDASQASMMFQYFVKIFPTVYVKVDGECPKMAAHGRTPFLPCGVTKMAAAGTRDLGKAEEETVFDPTSLDPKRCESCYGAETEDIRCCNSCDDVREAYRRKGWAFKTPDSIAQCKREGSARRWKSRGTRAAKCTGF